MVTEELPPPGVEALQWIVVTTPDATTRDNALQIVCRRRTR
jgi:hypothetical protein